MAWHGIREAWRSDRNLRIHSLVSVAVALSSWWVGLTAIEWAVILLTCGLVWTAELLNTAIEAVTDLASPDEHELARQAKDIASGAVLVAAIVAIAVGLLILGFRNLGTIGTALTGSGQLRAESLGDDLAAGTELLDH